MTAGAVITDNDAVAAYGKNALMHAAKACWLIARPQLDSHRARFKRPWLTFAKDAWSARAVFTLEVGEQLTAVAGEIALLLAGSSR